MAIPIHLMMCRYCARFRRQLLMLRQLSRLEDVDSPTDAGPEQLSAEAKQRIKRMMRTLH